MQIILFILSASVLLNACSSTPKATQKNISFTEAEAWMVQYCSPLTPKTGVDKELFGELVVKSKTKEFKGQYPASIHFEKNGKFVIEATHILGGTVLRMNGDADGIDVLVPSKPKFNRSGVSSYMGLEMKILMQLLHGDLPCPTASSGERLVRVDRNTIVSESLQWKWIFERAGEEDHFVPVSVRLVSRVMDSKSEQLPIEMKVEEWDVGEHYAKKVSVKTAEGELKWTWRSRELK